TRMVKIANLLLLQLAIASVIFLVVAVLLELGGASFATDPGFVLQVLFVLILLSLAVIGITVFVQTSKTLMSGRAGYDPIGRAFQVMSLGAILSEQHAVLGLILTFPSEHMNLTSAVRGGTSLIYRLTTGLLIVISRRSSTRTDFFC